MAQQSLIVRIDDRLIHGQVLVGWGNHYSIKRIVVGNDEIADNEWEKNLLLMAVAAPMEAQVLSLEETLAFTHAHIQAPDLSMVLLASPLDLARMAENGLQWKQINLGGIHYEEGRRQFLPYLFLSDREITLFRRLMKEGFRFECQDVPGSNRYNLEKVLG
ncbi:MAG: PTS sugar transporter subunit IIB [Calditrichaeota bacterium]|nr:PTS sugar transporter subunit IIB [Calditrichota bacterium]MCB0296642.1 PTS sugar transporter subunit IIB [Calditrichota bacterium]MCB0303459.1 PTS sugar transporter subunit IIB [Calditrichota bacterium]MCB0312660.1 PTS sugar transporter subunit IIB [Calditrichota bacterium]MCB9089211.1 PTS sugar transporter subunit IIB [Calditrichia bacterium]